MSDEINKYYEAYRDTLGEGAYKMQEWAWTSRVLFLKQYIEKYVPKGGKILDIGCGDMHLSSILTDYNWTGIDIDPGMSGKAVKHDLMSFPYPFEEGSFHAVVCSEVLEHLWRPEQVHTEVKRLLKAQGTYILSTPNYDYIDHHLYAFRHLLYDPVKPHLIEHIRQFNYETHKAFLENAGFQVCDHAGADAQYSQFFLDARATLHNILNKQLGVQMSVGQVDQILGVMFPRCNHTIIVVSKPK